MTDKQLISLTESVKNEVYRIIKREQNKLTAEFKTDIKAIIDERTRRGEISIGQIMWSCGDCVLSVLNMNILPWFESEKYAALKASVEKSETEYVQMNLVPEGVEDNNPTTLDHVNNDVDLNENPFFSNPEYVLTEVTKENFKEVTSTLPIVSEDVFDSIRRAQDVLEYTRVTKENFKEATSKLPVVDFDNELNSKWNNVSTVDVDLTLNNDYGIQFIDESKDKNVFVSVDDSKFVEFQQSDEYQKLLEYYKQNNLTGEEIKSELLKVIISNSKKYGNSSKIFIKVDNDYVKEFLAKSDFKAILRQAKQDALDLQTKTTLKVPDDKIKYIQALETIANLSDRKEYLESYVQSVDAKLNNETYVQNAKPEIIANEREKKAQVDAELKKIELASNKKTRTKKTK